MFYLNIWFRKQSNCSIRFLSFPPAFTNILQQHTIQELQHVHAVKINTSHKLWLIWYTQLQNTLKQGSICK